MLYIRQGIKNRNGNIMHRVFSERSDFEELTEYTPKVFSKKNSTDLKQYKDFKAEYCISGYIEEDDNGLIIRNNQNLVRRTLIFIDLDDLNDHDEINKMTAKLSDYTYLLYPTISCSPENPRYRLVIEPSRPLVDFEYKYMLNIIMDQLGVKFDPTTFTWSQQQGLPIITELNKPYTIKINRAKQYPIPEKIDVPKPLQIPQIKLECNVLDNNKALEIFKNYVNKNREELKEYNHFLSTLMVIAKAVTTNEIEYNTALECAVILADGNSDYANGNINKLNYELNQCNNENYFTTQHTFYSKFNGIKINGMYKGTCKTMDELFNLLKSMSNDYKANFFTDFTSTIKKIPIMPPQKIAKTLIDNHYFIMIGDKKDNARLYIYDFDLGLYIENESLIKQLIRALDDRTAPKQWHHVLELLKQDSELHTQTQDRFLIPCNNGIYNVKTKKLEPYSPFYVFTSKIANDYIENAPKPTFWDVDEWFSSIACGDEEIVTLLWQVINESINGNYTRKKIGFLYGGGHALGNNGKGTFQDLIKNLLGKNNISTLKPHEFNEKFKLGSILGKICNIGDDISNGYIDDVSNLMSVATGDSITAENKGESPYNVTSNIFCLFSANELPRVRNKSGWHRRVLIIPFNADFNGQKENSKIKDEYIKNKKILEYVLFKALQLEFDNFIEPKAVKKATEDYHKHNDYVLAYIDEEYIANNLHTYPIVPLNFVRENIFEYFDKERIKQNLPYGFGALFCEKLTANTGQKYELQKKTC